MVRMCPVVLSALIAPIISLQLPTVHVAESLRALDATAGRHRTVRCVAAARRTRLAHLPSMSAAADGQARDPEDEADSAESSSVTETGDSRRDGEGSPFDMTALSRRISSVQEQDELRGRLEALPQAYVLVFNEDTDDETVYSMEVAAEGETPVVLAFESEEDAALYAESLEQSGEMDEDDVASVQALDVEALVVTSREADIRVAIVFKGDLEAAESDSSAAAPPLLITSGDGERRRVGPLSLTITMVPSDLSEDKSSADFLDPSEDPVWVLVHDEGTADAQYFSMTLNGTSSVVCFKDEAAAKSCSLALENRGEVSVRAGPTARSLLLGDLLETLDNDEVDVCLVDEVLETILDDDSSDSSLPGVVASDANDLVLGAVGGGGAAGGDSTASPASVRAMLNRLMRDSGFHSGSLDEEGDDDRLAPG